MLVFLKDENIFRKFSIDKNGIKKIKNEAMGLKWYEKKLKSPSKFFVKASIKKIMLLLTLK